ncbi:unnamed protein product [Symbiodinium sp. CCMP2592]|nr:unnamed protein product [Symbiodinium sp. CCMP2592]
MQGSGESSSESAVEGYIRRISTGEIVVASESIRRLEMMCDSSSTSASQLATVVCERSKKLYLLGSNGREVEEAERALARLLALTDAMNSTNTPFTKTAAEEIKTEVCDEFKSLRCVAAVKDKVVPMLFSLNILERSTPGREDRQISTPPRRRRGSMPTTIREELDDAKYRLQEGAYGNTVRVLPETAAPLLPRYQLQPGGPASDPSGRPAAAFVHSMGNAASIHEEVLQLRREQQLAEQAPMPFVATPAVQGRSTASTTHSLPRLASAWPAVPQAAAMAMPQAWPQVAQAAPVAMSQQLQANFHPQKKRSVAASTKAEFLMKPPEPFRRAEAEFRDGPLQARRLTIECACTTLVQVEHAAAQDFFTTQRPLATHRPWRIHLHSKDGQVLADTPQETPMDPNLPYGIFHAVWVNPTTGEWGPPGTQDPSEPAPDVPRPDSLEEDSEDASMISLSIVVGILGRLPLAPGVDRPWPNGEPHWFTDMVERLQLLADRGSDPRLIGGRFQDVLRAHRDDRFVLESGEILSETFRQLSQYEPVRDDPVIRSMGVPTAEDVQDKVAWAVELVRYHWLRTTCPVAMENWEIEHNLAEHGFPDVRVSDARYAKERRERDTLSRSRSPHFRGREQWRRPPVEYELDTTSLFQRPEGWQQRWERLVETLWTWFDEDRADRGDASFAAWVHTPITTLAAGLPNSDGLDPSHHPQVFFQWSVEPEIQIELARHPLGRLDQEDVAMPLAQNEVAENLARPRAHDHEGRQPVSQLLVPEIHHPQAVHLWHYLLFDRTRFGPQLEGNSRVPESFLPRHLLREVSSTHEQMSEYNRMISTCALFTVLRYLMSELAQTLDTAQAVARTTQQGQGDTVEVEVEDEDHLLMQSYMLTDGKGTVEQRWTRAVNRLHKELLQQQRGVRLLHLRMLRMGMPRTLAEDGAREWFDQLEALFVAIESDLQGDVAQAEGVDVEWIRQWVNEFSAFIPGYTVQTQPVQVESQTTAADAMEADLARLVADEESEREWQAQREREEAEERDRLAQHECNSLQRDAEAYRQWELEQVRGAMVRSEGPNKRRCVLTMEAASGSMDQPRRVHTMALDVPTTGEAVTLTITARMEPDPEEVSTQPVVAPAEGCPEQATMCYFTGEWPPLLLILVGLVSLVYQNAQARFDCDMQGCQEPYAELANSFLWERSDSCEDISIVGSSTGDLGVERPWLEVFNSLTPNQRRALCGPFSADASTRAFAFMPLEPVLSHEAPFLMMMRLATLRDLGSAQASCAVLALLSASWGSILPAESSAGHYALLWLMCNCVSATADTLLSACPTMDPSVLEDADLAALQHELSADLQIDGGDFGDQLSHANQDCDTAERRPLNPWLLLDSGEDFQAVSEDASQHGVEAAASEDDASAEVQWYKQVAEDFLSSDVESHHKQSQWSLVEQHPSVPAASPRVTAEGYQTAAFHAVPAKATLSLPWESGVWSALFGASASGDWLQQVTPAFNRPVQPTSGQPEESLVPASSGLFSLSSKPRQDRVFMAVVSQSLDVSWEEQRTLDFDRSVKLWLHTILRWDVDCEVRQMLCEEDSVQGQIGLLEDFFRGRAPSTLLKRARALAKVANWLQEKGAPAYPISEKLFYEFLRAERALGAPASRLKGYHEAIVFSRFVLGVAGLELATACRRCLGATKSDEPRDRKQAQPLTVQRCWSSTGGLTARARTCGTDCSVAPHFVWSTPLDYDTLGDIAYLEITVASHKTMHSSQHRFQFLPMVSIALGSVPGRMALVYSRDGAARSLRLLEVMLEEIRSGFYLPDSTRSGRLRGPAREILEHASLAGENRPETGHPRARVGPEAVKAELTSDFGDGAVEILGSEDEQEAAATERAADSEHVTTDSSGYRFLQHKKTRMLHLIKQGNERVLECGRMVGPLERRLAQEVIDVMAYWASFLEKKLVDPACTGSDCKNAKNIKSFRKLAFAIGTPQTVADLRTLHFEATAFVVAVLKEHVTGELCPSHALCDMANTIYETSVMTWISPSKCSKRDAEIQSVSKVEAKSAISLEKQSLVVVPHEPAKADTSTELRLQWALMRRGVAFDQCRLLSWEIHQKWVTILMEAMCEAPPPGYSAIGAAQVVRADRELWTLLARDFPGPYKVNTMGALQVELGGAPSKPDPNTQASRLVLGALPRGKVLKPLVPEFGRYLKVLTYPETGALLRFMRSLPKGAVRVRPADPQEQELVLEVSQHPAKLDAALVHSTDDWSGDRILLVAFHVQGATSMSCADQRRCTELGFVLDVGAAGDRIHNAAGVNRSSAETVFVGVPSDPEEFIRKAVEAGHPMDMGRHVCPAVDRAIKANFCDPPELVIQRRLSTLERWESRAAVLDPLEAEANCRRPHHIQTLLKGKRILLWICEIGYPDVKILDEVEQGLPLTGWMAESQVFASNPKPPTMSVETVVAMNRGFHALVKRRLSKRQDHDVEQKTWLETEEEIAKGWFWVDESGCWEGKIIAHRFGLLQKLKLRTIDDCSVGGLNCTVGLPEKMRATCGWLGRTYDLQVAYRQFGISSAARELLRIVVNKPGAEQPILLGANSLPFGAVGSVAGFLRLSMAIWTLGLVGLELCWSAYYDDFPTVTSEPLLENTSSCVDRLFRLIGLDYATEGKKAPQFASCFAALGVQVDLQRAQSGSIIIGHTSARKEELTTCIESILADGSMTSKEAEKLRGRLVFFEGFTFGRVAQVAVKHVGRHAQGSSGSVKLSADVKWALGMIKRRICHALPVTISAKALQTTYVFTDGAFEQGRGSFGGVLVSPHGRCVSYFAGEVSREAMHHLLASSTHPIYELELLPVLIAMQVWGRLSSHQQTVYYLDNEPARIGMIKRAGGTAIADLIISKASALECELGQHAWYARVPSHSNIADDPSRFYFERLHKLGAARVLLDESWVASLVLEAG